MCHFNRIHAAFRCCGNDGKYQLHTGKLHMNAPSCRISTGELGRKEVKMTFDLFNIRESNDGFRASGKRWFYQRSAEEDFTHISEYVQCAQKKTFRRRINASKPVWFQIRSLNAPSSVFQTFFPFATTSLTLEHNTDLPNSTWRHR